MIVRCESCPAAQGSGAFFSGGVTSSDASLSKPQRPALRRYCTLFANLPVLMNRENAKTRYSFKIPVVRDQWHVEPESRGCGPRIGP